MRRLIESTNDVQETQSPRDGPGILYVAICDLTLVVGHQGGAGRHKGRLGALLVQLPDGTQFAVGTGFTDAHRESPPPIGSTITFRFQELTDGGVPRFPSFVRVRRDA